MRISIIVSILFFIVLGCQSEKKYDVKTVAASNFSIEIPAFLNKTNILHEEATLQYQNLIREYYTVVIEEPIDEFQAIVDIEPYFNENYTPDLDGYTKLIMGNILDNIEVKEQSEIHTIEINGLPCRKFEISGKVDGMDIYYNIAYLQGKTKFYQVVNWTLLGNKKDYATSMHQIIASFKEKN
ncbi:MAG: hypothetical protein ACK4UK_04645 [Flavobacterium sp.]